MSKRISVECPGCGRYMGVGKPMKMVSGGYKTRMFCPCGWIAGFGMGKTEEEAIDAAFEKARIRYKPMYNPHLGE